MTAPNPILVYGLLIAIGIAGGLGDSLIFKGARQANLRALLGGYAAWLVCLTLLTYYFRIDRHGFTAALLITIVVHVVVAAVAD